MARALRVEIAGGAYHVVSRGNGRQPIYVDDADRRAFIEVATEVRSRYGWRWLTYCLMDNHYHLLVETPAANLSRGMRQLNGVYAQRFNRRHSRVGPLFAGRYRAVLLQGDRHLLAAARYIALNPVRARICSRPEDWLWSGHRALIGAEDDALIESSRLLAHFGSPGGDPRRAYAEFVAQDTGQSLPGEGQVITGSPEFIKSSLPLGERQREVPRRHFLRNPRPLAELLSASDRDEAIARAHREDGYLLREIADALGCHYATVSRRLRELERHEMEESGE